MTAKNIPDFDPELLSLEDLFEFFDVSAQANRRGAFSDLAGVMAGPGLQDYDGKLGLGGVISQDVYTLAENETEIYMSDLGAQYFEDYKYISEIFSSYYVDMYDAVGNNAGFFMSSDGLFLAKATGSGSVSRLEIVPTQLQLYSEDQIYSVANNTEIRNTDRVFFSSVNSLAAKYLGDYSLDMDTEDRAIVDAGWVRSKLPGGSNEFTASFSNDFGQSSEFEFLPASFSISNTDGPDVASLYGAVGVLQLSFTDSTTFSGLGLSSTIGFENLSNLGSSKAATGSASAPSSYLGDPTYWLGRPARFIRAVAEGVLGLIPFYSL